MTQAVRDVILKPMRALYPPPQHLRNNPKSLALALAAYEKALGRFDRDTLQRGWDRVVAEQTFWVWPNPGHIAEACRQCAPRPKAPSEEGRRQQQALDMADAYVARYVKTSHVARLARQEGWAGALRDHVHDAAWVQAQLICQVRHIGWNVKLARDLGQFASSRDAFAAYRQTVEKAVERGQVRVTVPQALIRGWKEQARAQPHGAGKGQLPGG